MVVALAVFWVGHPPYATKDLSVLLRRRQDINNIYYCGIATVPCIEMYIHRPKLGAVQKGIPSSDSSFYCPKYQARVYYTTLVE